LLSRYSLHKSHLMERERTNQLVALMSQLEL
jgi:hypothetical protein